MTLRYAQARSFWLCLPVLATGCDVLFPDPGPRVTRIDIYADRITYRTGVYETPSALAIGLAASSDPPRLVALHDCERLDVFEQVLDAVRAETEYSFQVELPDDC
jgi:hypothetical protein